jgi:hypothetical protein
MALIKKSLTFQNRVGYFYLMKPSGIYILLIFGVSIAISGASGLSAAKGTPPRLSAYEGKSFAGPKDPEFKNYERALQNHIARRIQKRFGIDLDSKSYSGFDLLEIEALFRMKKSDEPLDLFLKLFPKTP